MSWICRNLQFCLLISIFWILSLLVPCSFSALFTFAHTDFDGIASISLLKKKSKICCAAAYSSGAHAFECCCYSREGIINLMQLGPSECEAYYIHLSNQHPVNSFHITDLLFSLMLLWLGLPVQLKFCPRIKFRYDCKLTDIYSNLHWFYFRGAPW